MTNDLDFGVDMSATTEIRPGTIVTGPRLVAEALFRRYTTPRGDLRGGEDEANYGEDLTEIIGSVDPKNRGATLSARCRNEALKDDRIDAAALEIEVLETTANGEVSFQIRIDAGTAAGPFSLTMSVSLVTVELVEITP